MNNPILSIIVPVFNVEKYLSECLNSIINQTLKNIEIICVDDGSTDNSIKILNDFQQKDSRIKIISKQNTGYGHTMNIGIENATGEYIGFVESDDFIEKNMFKFLYNKAKKYNLDIARSDFFEFTEKKTNYIFSVKNKSYYNKILTPNDDFYIFDFRMNTWASIYKTTFIKENNIKHNESPGASFQDAGFWFQSYMKCNRLMIFNKAFYHYRQDNINSSINSKEKSECIINEFKFIKTKIDEIKNNSKILNIFYRQKYFHYLHNFYRIKPVLRKDFINIFSNEFNKVNLDKLHLNEFEYSNLSLIKNNSYEFLELNKEKSLKEYYENIDNFSKTKNIIKKLILTFKIYGIKGLIKKFKSKLF